MPAGRDERLGWTVEEGGLRYLVKAPANYDARRRHPLLVVFAPAGASAEDNERYTRMTPPATQQGVVVAYLSHRRLSLGNVKALARIVPSVAKRWCIDPARVYFAGHSDGGTVSTVLALLPETRALVRGIAVSAAGFQRVDAESIGCPPGPLRVMVMHGRQDTHFPGFGAEMVRWWSECFRCDAEPAAPDAQGCRRYANCGASELNYCEGPRGHVKWPGLEDQMVEFLLRGQRPDAEAGGDGGRR
jgi:polyhydroxybutyrate depolymerase